MGRKDYLRTDRSPITDHLSRLHASSDLRAALEVEITAQRQHTLEALLDDNVDGARSEAAVGCCHPPVDKVPVLWKEYAQRFVYAEEMSRAIDQVAAVGERLTLAIARERGTIIRGKAQQCRLLGRRH